MMSDNYLDRFDEDAKNPKHHHLDIDNGSITIVGAARSDTRIVELAHQIAATSPMSFDHAIVELRKLENQPIRSTRPAIEALNADMAPIGARYKADLESAIRRPSNATKKGFNPRDKNKAKQACKSRKRNRK